MNEPAAAVASPDRTSPRTLERPPRVGLISNVRSGRNRKQLPKVERIVADHPRIHHYPTRDEAELGHALRQLRKAAIDVLAINGGDGTMAHVLGRAINEHVFDTLPAIALLPGGTTNMNAGDVGVRGNLISALRRLRDWVDAPAASLHTQPRPLLRLITGGGGPPAYGMFFGAGAIIQGVEYCNRHTKHLQNELGPGLAMVRSIWGIIRNDPRFARPVSMMLHDPDGNLRELNVLLLVASGLERHFAHLHPFWGHEALPLHTTLIEAAPRHFLHALPGLLRGRPNRYTTPEAGYHSHNVAALRFTMDGTVTLDGEFHSIGRDTGPSLLDVGPMIEFLVL